MSTMGHLLVMLDFDGVLNREFTGRKQFNEAHNFFNDKIENQMPHCEEHRALYAKIKNEPVTYCIVTNNENAIGPHLALNAIGIEEKEHRLVTALLADPGTRELYANPNEVEALRKRQKKWHATWNLDVAWDLSAMLQKLKEKFNFDLETIAKLVDANFKKFDQHKIYHMVIQILDWIADHPGKILSDILFVDDSEDNTLAAKKLPDFLKILADKLNLPQLKNIRIATVHVKSTDSGKNNDCGEMIYNVAPYFSEFEAKLKQILARIKHQAPATLITDQKELNMHMQNAKMLAAMLPHLQKELALKQAAPKKEPSAPKIEIRNAPKEGESKDQKDALPTLQTVYDIMKEEKINDRAIVTAINQCFKASNLYDKEGSQQNKILAESFRKFKTLCELAQTQEKDGSWNLTRSQVLQQMQTEMTKYSNRDQSPSNPINNKGFESEPRIRLFIPAGILIALMTGDFINAQNLMRDTLEKTAKDKQNSLIKVFQSCLGKCQDNMDEPSQAGFMQLFSQYETPALPQVRPTLSNILASTTSNNAPGATAVTQPSSNANSNGSEQDNQNPRVTR